MSRLRNFLLPVVLACILCPDTVFSQDKAMAFTYAPEWCDFSVALPGVPEIIRHCDKTSLESGACQNETARYAQAFGMQASLDFWVTCEPDSLGDPNAYDPELLKTTLEMITEDWDLDAHDVDFGNRGKVRVAVLSGHGRKGVSPAIFFAQMTVGPKSILTTKAVLSGEEHEEAGLLFQGFLQGIKPVDPTLFDTPKDESPKPESESPDAKPSQQGSDKPPQATP